MSRPIPPPKVWPDAVQESTSRRLWAAEMLTENLEVCRSILAGRPVLARQLDAAALRRALRGRPLPDPETYLAVTAEMLDAIAEGGPFNHLKGPQR